MWCYADFRGVCPPRPTTSTFFVDPPSPCLDAKNKYFSSSTLDNFVLSNSEGFCWLEKVRNRKNTHILDVNNCLSPYWYRRRKSVTDVLENRFIWPKNKTKKNTGRWQYFPDTTGPNIRKGQRLLAKRLSKTQNKGPPQLFGRVLIRKVSVKSGEHSKQLLLLNTSHLFFLT